MPSRKNPVIRFRYVYMILFSILSLLAMIAINPDHGFIDQLPFGAGAIATIAQLLKVTLYIAMLHISRRALFDYIDLEELFIEAKKGNPAAAQALIAIGLAMIAIAIIIVAVV